MIVLALDTSTTSGSVALSSGHGRDVQLVLPGDKPASETLLPAIEVLLAQADVRKEAVGGLAVGVGPGSFTGLRVGLATVKGWAAAASLPIAPVVSLDAVALPVLRTGRPALVAADARKGEVYAAIYAGLSPDGLPVRRGHVILAAPEPGAAYLLGEAMEGSVLVGTGVGLVRPFAANRTEILENASFDPHPRALSVLDLGRRLLALGRGTDPGALLPFYVRAPDVRHPGPADGGRSAQ